MKTNVSQLFIRNPLFRLNVLLKETKRRMDSCEDQKRVFIHLFLDLEAHILFLLQTNAVFNLKIGHLLKKKKSQDREGRDDQRSVVSSS